MVEDGITGKEVLAALEPALRKEVICLQIDDALADLGASLPAGATVRSGPADGSAALEVLRHSQPILWRKRSASFPEAKLAIGPAIETAFTTILTCRGR